MFKVAIFLFMVVAILEGLPYEGAPLDYKGEVIDTFKDVLIAKEKHYAAWDKANYDKYHGKYDDHYDGFYDHHYDPHYDHGHEWISPEHY